MMRSAEEIRERKLGELQTMVLRWGPGWWLDHASRADTEEGVGQQLREIRSDDPSQSLRPRRP